MATEPGKSGKTSNSIGGQVEGDHHAIGVGGGAPANGGDGKQSLQSPDKKYPCPAKDINSGDL